MTNSSLQTISAVTSAGANVAMAAAEVAGVLPTQTFYSTDKLKEIYDELKDQLNFLRAQKKDNDVKAERNEITHTTSYAYNEWSRKVEENDSQIISSLHFYQTEIPEMDGIVKAISRMNIGERMNSDIKRIRDLLAKLTTLTDILVPKEADAVVKYHNVPDIKGFETLEKPMNTIIDLLKKTDVSGIQIHGILGSGKSTIMQNLNNHGEIAKMFHIVIWLKVSSDKLDAIGNEKNFSLEELQRDVLQRLNLLNDINQVHQYKQKISEKLKDKKYLLLLDGVKESLSIDDIGFPGTFEKDSKIVLTTRKRNVCPLLVDRSIKVESLTLKEAKKMFFAILNPKLRENQSIMRLVPRVLKWCGNLPTVIKIVAGYFKLKEDVESWRNGLNSLNCWPIQGDDMIKEMCRSFRFCCEYLEGADKNCFYYGALYAEESNIYKDRLLDCWMALDFWGTRADGQCALERLNDQNLFEEDEHKSFVRMHKLIRLVALHNLQTDGEHKCLVLSNKESLDQQDMESWKEKHWISLADNKNLKTFTSKPDCSVLSTLFLQGNSNFKEFPEFFFQQVGSLCVLDLMGTGIKSLPNSLMNATKLKVLYLNECTNLVKLPSEIGNLEFLEVLDISGSGVDDVPPEIRSLENLKRFIISSRVFSKIFNVISHLTKLQEVLIDTKLKKEIYNWGIINIVMESAFKLRNLTSVQFRFLNDEVVDVIKVVDDVTKIYAQKEDDLRNFLQKDGLDTSSFQVFIGCPISPDVKIPKCEKFERYVKYYNGKARTPTFLKLLSKADSIEIDNCDLEHLSEYEFSNLSTIKGCLLENCSRIKYISGNYSILSNLERFYLNDLPELESIWSGSIILDNKPKLKTLTLSRCPKLIKLVSQDAVSVIQYHGNAVRKLQVFPNLKKLILVEMPNMTSIWENELLDWPSLKSLEIRTCPALHFLPFNKLNASKLTSIKAEKSWFEALQWTKDEDKQHFREKCTFGRRILPNTGIDGNDAQLGLASFSDLASLVLKICILQ